MNSNAPHADVLEYQGELVRLGRSDVWRIASEQVRNGLSARTQREIDLLFPIKGSTTTNFHLINHLRKHFGKRTLAALTWEELAALIECKKYQRYDPRWYADRIKPSEDSSHDNEIEKFQAQEPETETRQAPRS